MKVPKVNPRFALKNPVGSWTNALALSGGMLTLGSLILQSVLERAFFAAEVDVHLVLTVSRPRWAKLDAYAARSAKFLREAGAVMPSANLRMRVPVRMPAARIARRWPRPIEPGERDMRLEVRLALPAHTSLASAASVLHRLEQLAKEAMAPFGAKLEGASGSLVKSLRPTTPAPWYGAVEKGFTAAPVFANRVYVGDSTLGSIKRAKAARS